MKKTLLFSALFAALALSACAASPTPAPTPTLDPVAQAGREVFNARCATCHAVAPNTIIIGPSLYGVATRAETRVAGQSAEEYITMSILRPGDYVVDGFNDIMTNNFSRELTSEELKSLVAFLLTLK